MMELDASEANVGSINDTHKTASTENAPNTPFKSVLAIDIGLRNLAYCLLSFETLGPSSPLAPKRRRGVSAPKATCAVSWHMATRVAGALRAEHTQWQTLALGPAIVPNFRRVSEAQLLEWITEFFVSRQELFYEADVVVIEQQRGTRLRVLAGALFALAHQTRRMGLGKSPPELQTPFCKLAFTDVVSDNQTLSKKTPKSTTSTGLHSAGYQARKRTAVRLVSLLTPHLPHALTATFEESVKKDDLADALLHALWRACRLGLSSPGA
jgi:hypothetical protein